MRTPSANAKSSSSLTGVITATQKLWRSHHLTYDQARYVAKEVRRVLGLERPQQRKKAVARLSRDEERRLIQHAYRMGGVRGLLMKTLFQTGARVSEFANMKAEDVFFDEQMILITKAKGGKSRYVPILPELAQELRTYLGDRTTGYLFETTRDTCYTPRRLQQLVKETAADASITKRVYPHLLRHSVATILLEREGCPSSKSRNSLGTRSWRRPRFMRSPVRRCSRRAIERPSLDEGACLVLTVAILGV